MIPIATGALITRHLVATEFVGPNAVYTQLIRWRKPLWLGTAKSKIFRVPTRPVIPKEDFEEIKRLFNEYRTYRESLRRYFMRITKENEVQFDEATVKQAEEEDYNRCLELNEEWNKEVAKVREAHQIKKLQDNKKQVIDNIEAKKKRDTILMNKIEDEVRKAKVEAHTFITPKNIDQAIEEALANVVSYNVAIDLEGNKYDGKYEPPAKEKSQKRLQAEQ